MVEIVLTEVSLTLLLGVIVTITLTCVNAFNGKNLNQNEDPYEEGKGKKKTSPKKTQTPSGGKRLVKAKSTASDEPPTEPGPSMMKPRFKRAESLRNEHVMFADEISADDEKFSPVTDKTLEEVAGILQNREEVPNVLSSGDAGVVLQNSFEDIHPLDDLGLEIRRKSLQATPTGSHPSSTRGSRTDLDKIAAESENSGSGKSPSEKKKALSFADQPFCSVDHGGELVEGAVGAAKLSKLVRKADLTQEEISSLLDLLLKKEEQSAWVDSDGNKKTSTLSQLRKDVSEKEELLVESRNLATSLQGKLKSLREGIPAPTEGSPGSETASDLETLKRQLALEKEENRALSASLRQQQGVIQAALKRIYPSGNEPDSSLCTEHQKHLEELVGKMREDDEERKRRKKSASEERAAAE